MTTPSTADRSARFVYVTYIRTTAEKVFEALTRPEVTRRYWCHENVSDWQTGSGWQHVRHATGEVDLVGKVIETDPPHRLVISWANQSQQEDPAAYSRVSFDIAPRPDGIVRLTVTHEDLQPGGGMLAGISEGWPLVLSSLKSFLETGTGVPM
ncbi:SRPBCC family protein [Frigidibacter sp. MR17.24]|uniref:SRPBCC family protein n=1 Tax=Frigidibacter sp. MR17.24 TaxID=3127345 RepID=UPI0030131099